MRHHLLGIVLLGGCLATGRLHAQPTEPKVIRSARGGLWSESTTWEDGKVPPAASRVQIREQHTVLYDVNSDQAIRSIHVAGTLTFARDRNTRLDVGLIKIQPGNDLSENGFDCDAHVSDAGPPEGRPALEVGTPQQPLDSRYTATIRLVYFKELDRESCPAIVCCGGRMDFHGAALSRTWVKLGAAAKKGDDTITLAERVRGWRAGDRILITATEEAHKFYGSRRPGKEAVAVQTEERTIKALDGDRLALDRPLAHAHRGEGEFRGEVANLSRNVVVESAEPDGVRGHTMYHRGSSGSISYAEFRHLGKEGLLGRYSLHYHLCGDTMRGSSVIGASIWDSHNRWLTIHGTNYLVVRDCVGYKSVGHGYFLEDGTEVFNVLDRNLAVQAFEGKKLPKQVFLDDPNDGAGFWWANSLNTFTRNVACENDHYGFRFDASPIVGRASTVTFPVQQADGSRKPVDVRTLPFVRFEDNEAHCDGRYGFNLGAGVERVGPDRGHPFVIRGTKLWEVHIAFAPSSPCVLVEGMRISRVVYGVYIPNYDNHVYRDLTISDSNGEPFNRGHDDRSIQYGPLTVDGLTFENVRGNPLIQISDDNPNGTAVSHFRNVKVVRRPEKSRDVLVNRGVSPRAEPTTKAGVPVYLHDHFGPGRHAKVVSTRAQDLINDGSVYHEEAGLTGDESRVAEVRAVVFPKLLDPVDDLPPSTVITHIHRLDNGGLRVQGTTADNGTVKRVMVNGKQAQAVRDNFAQWVIVFDKAALDGKLSAFAEDVAGNKEKRPHEISVVASTSQAREKEPKENAQKPAQEKPKLPEPTHRDVQYGPHRTKNVLDFWQAEAKGPTPILVSIHHGGFSQGQKFVRADLLKECLDAGISVAAINYRLTEQAPAPAQFRDGARAVQFLRTKAKDWNIDPRRIAATGGSSGGGISLWLAFHDDLADPKNIDPVLRESSRLTCAAVFDAQTSYDPRFIQKLFPEQDVYRIQNLAYLFRVDLDKLDNLPPEKYKLFEEVSPLTHLSKDDPPVLLSYRSAFDAKVTTAGIGIHHPRFGTALKEKMDELQVPCELDADGKRFGDGTPVTTIEFLKKHFAIRP